MRHAASFDEYAERFWSRVDKSGDCWHWTGGTGHWGYGHFRAKSLRPQMGYREQLAHRWAWIFTHGSIPGREIVLHSCDNPPCVRPDHLRLGTHQDNADDREARGRRVGSNRGERNGAAVLGEADVRRIRDIYTPGSMETGGGALAREYGVTQGNISRIIRGLTWKHLL